MIEIICTNNNLKKEYPIGTTLQEIAEDMKVTSDYPILAAKVNNEVKSLHYEIYKNKVVHFIDATDVSGYMIYERSLHFLLYKAVKELYPTQNLVIGHSISGGKYCEFEDAGFTIDEAVCQAIEQRMRELVEQDIPFIREELPTKEALQIFEKEGLTNKKNLIEKRNYLYTSVYHLGDCINYFYGCLAPSTRYLRKFGLKPYGSGLLMMMPSRHHPNHLVNPAPSPKLFNIFSEYKTWNKILGISYVSDINRLIDEGNGTALLMLTEALQEKKIAQVADHIKEKGDVKIVLLSGPSSSGKTTTSKRVSLQLAVLGYFPVPVSMDNYFVERGHTPLDKDGKPDFEHLNAIDLDLFNSQMNDLIHGKEIDVPTFDFQQGTKVWKGNKLKLGPKGVLVIEGIHALNPALLPGLPQSQTFRIFASALTTIAIDLDLFNSQMNDLIHGKEIDIPTFDFQQGTKVWKGNKLKLGPKGVLVIEGIHALNPALLPGLPQSQTFRIFASALTTIAIDRQNPIHTTDNRLIRRIIRDSKYRGYSAENTLLRWESVRKGETKWIFPYQENADEMFNSAICCELNIFKPFALQQLYKVTEASDAYSEARRLIKMLEYFTELPEKDVPHSSILREFFGGSVFKY
ncbi:MAG: hypothetical protein IIU04_04160 [Bacteroidales bacterium]|nr:hypothetical protein [Bacteroidales bacterium]